MTTKKKKVTPKKKKKMGRPEKKIDQKAFENMCAIQCTEKEICLFLDVSEKTLINWCKKKYGMTFSKVFQQKREGGKMSLRRMGWNHANQNVIAWIFLAKNFLGMKDKIDLDVTQEQKKTLKIVFVDSDDNKID